MSWIIGKAEDFLNKVDQAAGQALQKEDLPGASAQSLPVTSSQLTDLSQINTGFRSQQLGSQLTVTTANTATLVTVSETGVQGQAQKPPAQTLTSSSSRASLKRDKDEELFEFLNSPDNGSDANGASKKGTNLLSGKPSTESSRHSRQSSASSSTNGRGTDSGFSFIALPG